ncbi:hypothetical protein JRO89_XS05G0188800 [Xanthoceras sorbifolium]|uniref:Protein FAR1-RELATED SEQUENCE n=1 Tax=Xanthoceras sorbifolium TaxID=99658 RepID=A0ABQ8I2D6_9ROSI|nr:hypothetical protein JRO89_XS05G0188800 [Xanthoceras sorbifolium]
MTSLPMEGLRWAKVAMTYIVPETTNHEQNLREPQSGAVSMLNGLTYMPQVNNDRKPNLHQEFFNLNDVHAFYNIYAKEAGFSVRIGSSKKNELWNTLVYKIDKKMENDDCCVFKVDKRNEVIDRAREIICEKPVTTSRWTKTAKCDVVVDDKGMKISDFQDKSMLTCRTRLFQLASNVIENVVASEEASKILEDDLNNVLSEVKSVVRSDSISERHSSTPHIYNEPLAVRAKGCKKRLKGGKETAKGKTTNNSRRCNGCGKVGQSHDKRNCPMINNRGEDLQ